MIRGFKEFINSGRRNEYIYEGEVDKGQLVLYVRKSLRYIEGHYIKCIDIANISLESRWRGKKIFTNYMKCLLIEYGKENNFYIESILNPNLATSLKGLDFKDIPEGSSGLVQNMIRYATKDEEI